jgi:hypothetical protein
VHDGQHDPFADAGDDRVSSATVSYERSHVTYEASDAEGKPQHDDGIESTNINTEFKRIGCDETKKVAGERLSFNLASILGKQHEGSARAHIFADCTSGE